MFGSFGTAALRHALTMGTLSLVLVALSPRDALAHCDTMDGPVVTAARTALEKGDARHVLMWVRASDEAEVRSAFQQVLAVRTLGGDAAQLAERWFFETVVRLHRAGEGEPYTGLKPAGSGHTDAIRAADLAVTSGSVTAIEELLVEAVRHGLHERFERVAVARGFVEHDVEAGRRYVAAYVPLLHYVEQVHAVAAGASHGANPHP